jgi:hypothetical protein
MTCVAWDGRMLAADKRACNSTAHSTTTKIHRLPDGSVCGLAGDSAYCRQMVAWLMAGERVEEFPATQRNRETFASTLLLRPNGEIWKYEDTPHPHRIEDRFHAIGSGRDYALAAMHLGCDARRAVEVACCFDPGCGNGIDVLVLE